MKCSRLHFIALLCVSVWEVKRGIHPRGKGCVSGHPSKSVYGLLCLYVAEWERECNRHAAGKPSGNVRLWPEWIKCPLKITGSIVLWYTFYSSTHSSSAPLSLFPSSCSLIILASSLSSGHSFSSTCPSFSHPAAKYITLRLHPKNRYCSVFRSFFILWPPVPL